NKKGSLLLNLGDSRAYFQTDDVIKQITIDHTYKNAKLQPKGNISINSPCQMFGLETLDESICDNLKAYQIFPMLKSDDLLLMCTDGLSNFLADDFILHVIKKHKQSPKECLNKLIEHAIKNGSDDDISIILVQHHKGLTPMQHAQKMWQSFDTHFDDNKKLKWVIAILSLLVLVLLILQFAKGKPIETKATTQELTTESFKLNQDNTKKTDDEDNY
ncbi:MAG: SpoIIE family protein phosphatase, partial [Alcanivoracaceae bacterium]|nr:SpoIIE family protein phosphatase [Alcanivoracaceae bacterium]